MWHSLQLWIHKFQLTGNGVCCAKRISQSCFSVLVQLQDKKTQVLDTSHLLTIWHGFAELEEDLPDDVNLQGPDEGPGIEVTLSTHQAKTGTSLGEAKFNNTKVQRVISERNWSTIPQFWATTLWLQLCILIFVGSLRESNFKLYLDARGRAVCVLFYPQPPCLLATEGHDDTSRQTSTCC